MAVLVFIPFSPLASSFMKGFYMGYFAITALLALFNIFLYKKRKLQIRLCYALLLLPVLLYVIYFIFDRQFLPLSEFFQQTPLTFVFPFIAVILIYLAIRGIKKDEKLVRSLDRLR
jgi:glucose-6-phosphate-specific signal transduction histidine kinase